MKVKVDVKQINTRVWEVRAGAKIGIAVTEDKGKTWELSPAIRGCEKSVLKKLKEIESEKNSDKG